MSLVNDMLRDLDQRRQQPGEGSATGSSIAPAPTLTQAESKTRWLPLLLLCLAAGLALLGLWLYDNPQLWRGVLPSNDDPSTSVTTTQSSPTPEPKPVSEPSPAQLQTQADPQAEPQSARQAEPGEPSSITALASPSDQPPPVRLLRSHWLAEEQRARLALELSHAPIQQVQLGSERSLELQLGPVELATATTIESILVKSPVDWLQAELQQRDQLILRLDSNEKVGFDVSSQPISSNEGGVRVVVMISRSEPTPDAAAVYPVIAMNEPEPVQPKRERAESTQASSLSAKPSSAPGTGAAQPSLGEPQSVPMAVAPLTKSRPQSPAQRDRSQVAKARALVNNRQIRRAIEQLEVFVVEQPSAVRSRTLLGTLLIGTGQLARAEQQIDQGLALKPTDAGLKKLKARLLVQAQQLKPAIALLQAEQPTAKADAEYHQILAAALQADGQHQRAAETYHGLLRVRSDEPAWWVGLALSLEALDQPQQARQAYKNVLQIPDLKPALANYVTQRLNRL